jgi:oxygen-independent coproporphyrinogen-3 oxidase
MMDKADTLTFTRQHEPPATLSDNSAALYVHIPFCRHLCPFCPYNKIEYDPALAARYIRALRAEIRRARDKYGRLNVGSLYFGGGTPTVVLDALGGVMDDLRESFAMAGAAAIETTPAALTPAMATLMRDLGFGLVSLGVQSFQDRFLRQLGRPYDGATAGQACSILKQSGFQTLNLDLMFALPGQTTEDLRQDLLEAIRHGPDQITCYPLLTFPYAAVGRWLARNRVVVPPHRLRWKMYRMLSATLAEHGYERASVWSFTRKNTAAFSSVTRDRYLGFGAGAASYNGRTFTFNTFSVPAYQAAVEDGRFPTALGMPVSARLERMFWLYWRLYETRVPKAPYRELFGRDLEGDFPGIFRMVRRLGFVEDETDACLTLNTRGCHWVHLAQNLLALNDINTVWSAARATPYPNSICL